ncbi:MAG: glycosyltransferase family 2 protein [Candidatus Devosia phytovorans]|uniref:Glycosyltransferase family 2 protein n=1 Tax=Candidatus Devosia phytovorans TaxID=3121372 RepID=A0AAJ5VT19_9HYPH|nr:glycosyltransferase family 2 protein [Devosia sp.]WEK03792.1 MAG: glycosyltransferase family 2 protein [Devosia sp.]
MTDPSAPLVTIAMPVFNGGLYVAAAVRSIVAQSFADWELLIIDDGSTDGALGRLSELADYRIRLIRDGRNLGLAARLNQAIEQARGRYFARMDHDDVAHPERLHHQLLYMEGNPAVDLLGTKCVAISEDYEILGEFPFSATHAEICRRPWLGFYLAHPTWLGRTDWFRRHRYAQPAPFRCEDQELLLRAHANSTYHALATPLLAYRVRNRVELRSLLRTRMTLSGVQCHYFWGRGQILAAATAVAAALARMAKDVLLPPTGDRRAEVATELPAEEHVWWTKWLTKMKQSARPAG